MLNIVVADDETPIREWLVYLIKNGSKDFNVVAAVPNGSEAYAKILEFKPDVVITDIRMPGMNGIELMKAVCGSLPNTQFVILTNHADFSYARQAITFGAKEYLLKSEIRKEDLTLVLQKILDCKNSQSKCNSSFDYTGLHELYAGNGNFAEHARLPHTENSEYQKIEPPGQSKLPLPIFIITIISPFLL